MPVSVTMPRLGESVSEGTIIRWLKKEGEQVEADEPLLEVSTDKVDTEVPAPASGLVSSIKVAEDETVDVGTELAVIDDGATGSKPPPEGEQATAPAAQPEPEPEPEPAPAPAPAAPVPAAAGAGGRAQPAYVTPLVRKLAAEHDVNLASLTGTGVGGRVRKQDVLDAAQAQTSQPAAPVARSDAPPAGDRAPVSKSPAAVRGRTEKFSRLRGVIAQRMVESLQTSAQLTTVVEVDVTRIARLRERARDGFAAREGVRLSFLPFFAVVVVEALKEHPTVNSSIDLVAGTITYHDAVHLGIAVDTERGLLVPVIHGADDLNLAGTARKIADLATRSRGNQVTPDELAGGTFTITNTGSRGALFDTPIINQPQVAILGTGAVVKRPVVLDDPELGELTVVRSMVYLALTYDHRVVDGADAIRFLTSIKQRLEEGAFEADLGL